MPGPHGLTGACVQAEARRLFLDLVQAALLSCARQAWGEAQRGPGEAGEEDVSAEEAVLEAVRQVIAAGEQCTQEARVSKDTCYFEWAHLLQACPLAAWCMRHHACCWGQGACCWARPEDRAWNQRLGSHNANRMRDQSCCVYWAEAEIVGAGGPAHGSARAVSLLQIWLNWPEPGAARAPLAGRLDPIPPQRLAWLHSRWDQLLGQLSAVRSG